MKPRKLAPSDWFHLGSRIELHRARPQRDHCSVESEIDIGKLPQVTHHLGLAVVGREIRMIEITRGALTRNRDRLIRGRIEFGNRYVVCPRAGQKRSDSHWSCGLVERNRNGVCVDTSQFEAC
ncbi:unannotated protein [freshwater metagenome]|uniref:Unannotated protein n=1 Tax=freshwater metagenome TaxID=449393 RepID=A0A6J7HSR4_9ZZZZ